MVDKAQALELVKKLVTPGDTLYTILRHVSRSGMSRRVSVICIKENQARCLDSEVELLTHFKRVNRGKEGLVVHGVGGDVGFEVVHALADAVFGDGYKLTQAWL